MFSRLALSYFCCIYSILFSVVFFSTEEEHIPSVYLENKATESENISSYLEPVINSNSDTCPVEESQNRPLPPAPANTYEELKEKPEYMEPYEQPVTKYDTIKVSENQV